MRFAYAIVILALGVTACAEQPQRCGGGRTVDDYLADIAKSQKKKRNKNPLPDSVCVWGWCKHKAPTGPFPDPPSVDSKIPSEPKPEQKPVEPSPGTSSSKRPVEEIALPPSKAVQDQDCDPEQAAHDVEVGDYYYNDKNYRGALNRYKLALESWPAEPNILYRLAKSQEGLKDPAQAAKYYQLVVDADPDAPIAKEARASLTRLKK